LAHDDAIKFEQSDIDDIIRAERIESYVNRNGGTYTNKLSGTHEKKVPSEKVIKSKKLSTNNNKENITVEKVKKSKNNQQYNISNVSTGQFIPKINTFNEDNSSRSCTQPNLNKTCISEIIDRKTNSNDSFSSWKVTQLEKSYRGEKMDVNPFKYIPDKLMTQELIQGVISENPYAVYYIPV
jgi:hypothetical protein